MKDIEIHLWKYYREGDETARTELILLYVPLADVWAKRIARSTGAKWEDLREDGVIGLIKAIDRFDPSQGVSFGTFATRYIRGAIFDNSELIREKVRQQVEISRKVRNVSNKIREKWSREPTVEEVCEEADLTIEQIMRALDTKSLGFAEETSNSTRLVLRGTRDGFERLLELFKSGELSNSLGVAVEGIQWGEAKQQDKITHARSGLLIQALSMLSKREQLILRLYYWESCSSDIEIAIKCHLKEDLVRKIRVRAIDKLQIPLRVKKGNLTT